MNNNTSTNSEPQIQGNSTTPPVPNNGVAPPPIPDIDKPRKRLTATMILFGIYFIFALITKFVTIDNLASCNQKHHSINSSGPCTGQAFHLFFSFPVILGLLIYTIVMCVGTISEAKKAGTSGIHKAALVTIFASIAIAIFLLISFIIAVQ